jgi:hypothetical protein
VKPSLEVVVSAAKGCFAASKTGFGTWQTTGFMASTGSIRSVWIEAGDDAIAIEVAKEVLNGRNGELWQRGRFIARLDGVAPDA